MAAKSLLPGHGGAYTSEDFISTSAVGADTLDLSLCHSFAVQISSITSPAGDIQIEQTFNGSDWASYGSAIAVTDGTISRFDETDGPFGTIRINATGITAGAVTVTIVGFN